MTIGSALSLVALPIIGGLMLWLTSWMEKRVLTEVADPSTPPVVGQVPPHSSRLAAA